MTLPHRLKSSVHGVFRAGVVVLLALCCVLPARAAEWVYTVRPGDSLWTISDHYLKSIQYWPRVQDLNKVADPYHMPPGLKLRILVEWMKQPPVPATVVHAWGDVQRRGAAGGKEAARAGMKVYAGDMIESAEGGATIEFADGSRLIIEASTSVVMDTLSAFEGGAMVDTVVRVRRGRVESEVKPQGGKNRFQIITPAAVAAVRGTRYRVSAEAERPVMRSEVLEGEVAVAGAGVTQAVPAGYGLRAEEGKPPPPPRPLLPPADLSGLPSLFSAGNVVLRWPPLAEAVAYRVRFAPRADTAVVLREMRGTEPAADVSTLAAGSYVMRVRGIDELGIEGRDALHEFSVEEALTAPRPVTPNDGVTLPPSRVWMAWSRIEGAHTFRLQVARDAAFTNLAADIPSLVSEHYEFSEGLPPGGYHWRVAAVSRRGVQGPFGEAWRFSVADK